MVQDAVAQAGGCHSVQAKSLEKLAQAEFDIHQTKSSVFLVTICLSFCVIKISAKSI